MINYIAVNGQGLVIISGTAMNEAEAILDVGNEGTALIGSEYEGARPNRHYIKDNVLRECPPAPSSRHEFDCASEVWVDVTTDEESAAIIRFNRNALLAASDWTQVADAPADQAAWAVYRQELRDATSQETFPSEVTWPVAPQ